MILIQSFLSFCLYLVFIAKTLKDVLYNQQQIDWDTRIYILLVLIPAVVITQVRELKYLVPFSGFANAIMITAIAIVLYFILSKPLEITERNMWPQWSTLPSFIRYSVISPTIRQIIKEDLNFTAQFCLQSKGFDTFYQSRTK